MNIVCGRVLRSYESSSIIALKGVNKYEGKGLFEEKENKKSN